MKIMLKLQKKIICNILTIFNPTTGRSVERYAKEKEYLNSLLEPTNRIERSFCQYKCQRIKYGRIFSVIADLASIIVIPIYGLKASINSKSIKMLKSVDMVFTHGGMDPKIIPNELLGEYPKVLIENDFSQGISLNKTDRTFLFNLIKQYPFSPYFIYKSMMKIAMFSSIIGKYNPKAVLTCSEFSFPSSIVTEYCEMRGVLHLNTMHGEKFYNIMDSFVEFHRFYVWDEYYINIFKKLRANPNQFRITLPDSMQYNVESVDIAGLLVVDYKYYLGSETAENLSKICEILNNIKNQGSSISVRMHPRHAHLHRNTLKDILSTEEIEDPEKISIEQSLMTTKNVISKYSTVLNQAAMMNINYIIDDITEKGMYNKLLYLEYKMLKEDHKVLSAFI